MSSRRLIKQKGFTLIEIMVSLAILSVMTLLTASAIQNALRSREKMSGIIARESVVRDALRVIERDVNSAFHYRDFYFDLNTPTAPTPPQTTNLTPDQQQQQIAQRQAEAAAAAAAAQANPNDPAARKRPPQLTHFIGANERMDFSALSHVRTSQDAVESDQEEVGYYLASCKSRMVKRADSNCLWRRQSNEIDDDVTKGGEATVLVENVESFKLRYLGPDKEEWQESWKTDKNGDDKTRFKFPYAVEVSLKVFDKNDPKAKPVAMTMVAEIRFPNNSLKKLDANGTPVPDNGSPGAVKNSSAGGGPG